MVRIRNYLTFLGLISALCASVGASQAKPAGLVLDIEGTITPEIQPFDEVTTETSLELAKDARIVFQHYATCDDVTVVGGRLGFSDRRYLVRGGKIVDVSRGRCPETVELGKSSAIGGVVLRSGLGGPKLALRPVFVLVGGPWREVAAIRVLGGGRVIAELKPAGREVRWPEEAEALTSGGKYEIELVRADGGEAVRKKATARKNAGPLTLLRLD